MSEPAQTAGSQKRSAALPTDPAVIVASLLRTWEAGAGRITVTFGGADGDQWDVEQSRQRRTVSV